MWIIPNSILIPINTTSVARYSTSSYKQEEQLMQIERIIKQTTPSKSLSLNEINIILENSIFLKAEHLIIFLLLSLFAILLFVIKFKNIKYDSYLYNGYFYLLRFGAKLNLNGQNSTFYV